jgi:cell division septum initiation protein DivIVA
VRTREFAARRRGVDPEQVRDFQRELADDLTALYQELTILNQENERLKRALRDWQAMHARHCDAPDRARPNTGHW